MQYAGGKRGEKENNPFIGRSGSVDGELAVSLLKRFSSESNLKT